MTCQEIWKDIINGKKTYFIYGNFGEGFEEVCQAEDEADAKRLLQEYIENDRQHPYKIRIRFLKEGTK